MPDLRVGTFLAPKLLPMYEAITATVARRTGLTAELVVEEDYESCITDDHEICFVCSLPYVTFERDGFAPAIPVAAPVLLGRRYAGRPIYFSDVIVHRDSELRTFLDLRGRVFAYNESLSQSGYGIARHHLLTIGEISGFFGDVVASGFHHESIRMVRSGEADAAAIDSHVLDVALRDEPGLLDELRIVETLGPSTIQPIAVAKRLSVELRTTILDVLLGIHADPLVRPALDLGMVERFTRVDASSYDDIRRMLEECEVAGFMELA